MVKLWILDDDTKACPPKITSARKRFTILHAGCSLEFLEGRDFLLDSKIDSLDYHKTITFSMFDIYLLTYEYMAHF